MFDFAKTHKLESRWVSPCSESLPLIQRIAEPNATDVWDEIRNGKLDFVSEEAKKRFKEAHKRDKVDGKEVNYGEIARKINGQIVYPVLIILPNRLMCVEFLDGENRSFPIRKINRDLKSPHGVLDNLLQTELPNKFRLYVQPEKEGGIKEDFTRKYNRLRNGKVEEIIVTEKCKVTKREIFDLGLVYLFKSFPKNRKGAYIQKLGIRLDGIGSGIEYSVQEYECFPGEGSLIRFHFTDGQITRGEGCIRLDAKRPDWEKHIKSCKETIDSRYKTKYFDYNHTNPELIALTSHFFGDDFGDKKVDLNGTLARIMKSINRGKYVKPNQLLVVEGAD